jgi:hypothetical protein
MQLFADGFERQQFRMVGDRALSGKSVTVT